MRKAGTADRPVLERLWLMFRHDMLLTARLSGHQIMINGHALFPPLSVVATLPADPEPRSGWSRGRGGAPEAKRRTTWTVDDH